MDCCDEHTVAMTRRHFFGVNSRVSALRRSRLAASRSAARRNAERAMADYPASRTSRPRRSASSICFNPAARLRWSCSTTSRG